MLFSVHRAQEFFGALRAASVEFLKGHGLPLDQGRKRYAAWREGYPLGITEHFTAGVGWKGTVRWLNDGPNKNSVSCQMLILDRMLPGYATIIGKYPALKDLQVTVILLSDGIIPCWHAGWVNKLTFGIENRNVGSLRYDDHRWYWWAKNWSSEFPTDLGKTPVNSNGKWWEPYTYGQISANILVGQMLYCLYPAMDRRWFLPHSATSGRKMDTGPLFPLGAVRAAIFDQKTLSEQSWLIGYHADPQQQADYSEREDEEFVQELMQRQGDRLELDGEYDARRLDIPPEFSLQLLVEDGKWQHELPAIRRALNLLGYCVPASQSHGLDKDTALAVWIFQKSKKGLKADKIPGAKTQAAINERLKHFGL